MVAVDLDSGQPVAIARISELDLEGLIAWLKPLVKAYGVEVIVTDELPTYNLVAEAFGLKHGHCREPPPAAAAGRPTHQSLRDRAWG